MTPSYTQSVAVYASESSAQAIPQEAAERGRQVIFDEIACACFGQRSDAGKLASAYAQLQGGAQESRILGRGIRAAAQFAAMANGTAGHGEEVDGAHVVGGHPGASIVHAAVATAERQRAGGAEVLNAVLLGYDVGTRIVKACGGKFEVRNQHHLTSDFFYAFGCTAAAARLLRLSATQHCHAFALASFQTNGLYALYAEKNHISKSFCNGQYAFAGISAALMAQVGLEGNEDIIGAKDGLLDAWARDDLRPAVTAGLGTDFAIMGANFKFLNAGYPIHTAYEATMALIRDHAIATRDIASVTIGLPKQGLITVDNRAMHNICVQDMVAASIVKGSLRLDDLPFPAMLSDPDYIRLRPLVTAEVDAGLERDNPNGRGARVTITTTAGAQRSTRVDSPLGHSTRGGTTWEALYAKWSGVLEGCDIDRAIEMARKLEELPDINMLTDLFSGSART